MNITPSLSGGNVLKRAIPLLFQNGEKGVWYDPSDFSTMFQDSAGTTPVTAVGQPVGKILDKSGNGFHATQPTSTARPTLGRHPITGVRNLLTYTEDFSNAVWGKNICTITTDLYTAPDGSLTADLMTATGADAYMVVIVGGAVATTLSAYVKRGNSDWVAFSNAGYFAYFNIGAGTLGTVGNGVASINAVGNGWFRITWTPADITQNGTYRFRCAVSDGNTNTTNQTAIWWGAQLELGSAVTNYQKVVSQFDITEAGVNYVFEEFGDGVDNAMTVASGGGGTTGILLCAAVLPKATAAATLWSDAGTNTGYKLTLDATNHVILSAGNGTAYTSVTGPVLTAGTEYVVMAWHDGVNLNVQVNGGTITSAAFGTATAGTAGFSVMADNGTAANWFNGTIANLVYRQNDASTATDRANVLLYVNQKAGAY